MNRNMNSQPQGLSPNGRKFATCSVIVLVLLVLAGAFFTRSMWLPLLVGKPAQPAAPNAQVAPTAAAPSNNQPAPTTAQNGSQPATLAPVVNGQEKPTLTIAAVTFPSYLNMILAASRNNPAYNAVLVPLGFKTPDGTELYSADESDQVAKLTDGTYDILLTTPDTLAKHPGMGKPITMGDQSDGADATVVWNVGVTPGCAGKPIKIINDLKGCKIAVTGDSVSEFQALSALKVAGLSVNDVTLDTNYGDASEAEAAFQAKKVDAYTGWDPFIKDAVIEGQSHIVFSSKVSHTIFDGIFISHQADATKKAQIVEFLSDWFVSLTQSVIDPKSSAETIAAWTFKGYPTNKWTGISVDNSVDDFTRGLTTIAQAGYNQNLLYLVNPQLWPDMLTYERGIWEMSGEQLDGPFDPNTLFDPSYLQALAGRPGLTFPVGSTYAFVDNSFSPTSPLADETSKAPTAEELQAMQTVAEFNCPGVTFDPDKATLTSAQTAALTICEQSLVQMIAQSDVEILITGSAAQPDPKCYPGHNFNEQGTKALALQRATNVASILTSLNFPANRLAIAPHDGTLTCDMVQINKDRWVKIEIKASAEALR